MGRWNMCLKVTFIAFQISRNITASNSSFNNTLTFMRLSRSAPSLSLPLTQGEGWVEVLQLFDRHLGQFEIGHAGDGIHLDRHQVFHRRLVEVLREEAGAG